MAAHSDRAATTARAAAGDTRFRLISGAAAMIVLLIFAGVIGALFIGAMPAFKAFGFSFLTTEAWRPSREIFAALGPIYGTVITSIIAMVIALPVGIGIAVFLTELCPRTLRRPIGIAIELLAGIPSIIYGIWGLFVFAPLFQAYVQEPALLAFDGVPILGTLFGGYAYGIGIFTAGLILSIMILPFIAAVTRDVLETVPSVLKEAAYGLGSTQWEVMRKVAIPYARTGVVGGAMLALGRALGETMAVTFVIGNAHDLSWSLFSAGNSISSTLANEFAEAATTLHSSSLFALALILFAITFIVLSAAKLMLAGMARNEGTK